MNIELEKHADITVASAKTTVDNAFVADQAKPELQRSAWEHRDFLLESTIVDLRDVLKDVLRLTKKATPKVSQKSKRAQQLAFHKTVKALIGDLKEAERNLRQLDAMTLAGSKLEADGELPKAA